MRPSTFLLVAVAGWMSRRQQEVIEYLKEENRILREKLGRERLLLSVEQKRRLATKGRMIGRKLLEQFGTLFNPDTILRWHRELIAGLTAFSALGPNCLPHPQSSRRSAVWP